MEALIDDDLYSRRGSLPNNFTKTIPDKLQAFRAISMFKDEYLLDFINVEELFVRDKDQDERVVEQAIVHNVKNFIMTFGNDFTFVGNQYRLEKYGEIQFPDLLFFNRELKALVCVELKSGPFKTAYLGQLAGYLRILDDEVRKPDENPSMVFCFASMPTANLWNTLSKITTSQWVSPHIVPLWIWKTDSAKPCPTSNS